MGKTSNKSKQKWISKNFKQIKILVDPPTAEAFRVVCAASGQSMNKTLSRYMESVIHKRLPETVPKLNMATKSQRRKTLQFLLARLHELYDAECGYNENIPENLRGGDRYERSCQDIEKMDEAISLLEESF